jgi:hypothetical protein
MLNNRHARADYPSIWSRFWIQDVFWREVLGVAVKVGGIEHKVDEFLYMLLNMA